MIVCFFPFATILQLLMIIASYPGSFQGEEKEPGTHCIRMRVIAVEFRRDRILLRYVRKCMTSRQSATLAAEEVGNRRVIIT